MAPAPPAPAERGPLSAQPVAPPALAADTLVELTGAVEDLAGQFALQPLLHRILRRAVGLLGGSAGSVCTVDEAAGTYRKEADLGVACRQGAVFPLDEGTTGAVVARRAPVVFDRYADVPGGHLTALERRRMLATVAVPIEWAGEIIGSCVVFTSDPARRWTADDVALLQLFAGHAAVALTNARLHEAAADASRLQAVQADRERAVRDVHDMLTGTLGEALEGVGRLGALVPAGPGRAELGSIARSLAGALDATRATVFGRADAPPLEDVVRRELTWLRASAGVQTDLVVTGRPDAVDPAIVVAARAALQEVLGNVARHAGATHVRVGLLCPPGGRTTLLVIDDGQGFDAGSAAISGLDRAVEVVEQIGGTVAVETAEQFGTRVRIELPAAPRTDRTAAPRPLRVLVADPRPLVVAGLAGLARGGQPDLEVTRSVRSVADVRAAARDGDVDVVVLGSDPDLLDAVLADPGTVPVVVVGMVEGAVLPPSLGLRAHGVLGPDVSGAEFVRVVGQVAGGATVRPGSWPASEPDPTAALSPRERQVVELVGRGLPDKLVARELAISVRTVEKHVGSALRKTGLPNRTALAGRIARPGG